MPCGDSNTSVTLPYGDCKQICEASVESSLKSFKWMKINKSY